MATPIINVGSKFDAKGFKQAETAIHKLEKNVKSLAKAFGVTLGATALVAFGKASVDAFMKNEKQVAILTNSMKNLGQSFAAANTVKFIDSLSLATGVAKADLIPAFQQLDIATGDAVTSQNALKLAMDVSAGTGKDLGTVTTALSKGYLGNTTALTRLGAGLSKTLLATKDMGKITAQLSKTFSGDASVAANTYAGKLARIGVAAEEAKITIGKSMVEAFASLAGSNGLDSFVKGMDSAAQDLADMITGVGVLAKEFEKIPGFSNLSLNMIPILGPYLSALKQLGKSQRLAGSSTVGMPSGARAIATQEARTAAAKLAAAKKATAAQITNDKKAAALKLTLSKGNTAFDLTQIQIIAALKGTIDEDTKKRLLLMQALQGDDANLIMSRLKDLAEYEQNADLRKLAGLKTITDAQLKALGDTLAAEVDAINKSKMSQEDKNRAIMDALAKYDAAVKKQGGETSDQSDNLRVIQIRNILAVSQAQALADAAKQAALEKYMSTLGINTIPFSASSYAAPSLATQIAIGAIGGTTAASIIPTNTTSLPASTSSMSPAQLAAAQFGSGGAGNTTINVQGSIIDTGGLTTAVQIALQQLNRNGQPTAGLAGLSP